MKKFLMKLFVLGTTCCSLLATEVKVCFTPAMNCREEIINAINTAQAEILIQSYMFTDPDLADALIKAHKRSVNVLVIYDKRYASKPADKISMLKQAGIHAFADATSGLAHSKVMVIDRHITITGSYNFTQAAQDRNVENLVLIEDEEVANQFARQWFSRYMVQDERGEKKQNKKVVEEQEKEQKSMNENKEKDSQKKPVRQKHQI